MSQPEVIKRASRARAKSALKKLLARSERDDSSIESQTSQSQKRRIRRATQRKNLKIRQEKEKQKLWLEAEEEKRLVAKRAQANAKAILARNSTSEREIELRDKVMSLTKLSQPIKLVETDQEEDDDNWTSKTTRNYPGLTPGLAPVDAEDEFESD